jgi:hypothetical protein
MIAASCPADSTAHITLVPTQSHPGRCQPSLDGVVFTKDQQGLSVQNSRNGPGWPLATHTCVPCRHSCRHPGIEQRCTCRQCDPAERERYHRGAGHVPAANPKYHVLCLKQGINPPRLPRSAGSPANMDSAGPSHTPWKSMHKMHNFCPTRSAPMPPAAVP